MPRRRYRCTWDQITALDADYMARWGAFEPGCEIQVGVDGEDETLLIQYAMERGRDAFSARYTSCRIRDDTREAQVDEHVHLQRRPCRFGGHRVYFMCPWCRCPTLKLAVLPEGLRCRHCGSVTWGSRREHAPQRLVRRANKVAAKLQCDEWNERPTERPLHMRMAKFELLKAERVMLAERINHRLNRQFLRSARVRRLLAQRAT